MSPGNKHNAIVIGASAGGLSALSVLFDRLPENYPIPIIVVQHRHKEQRSLLEDILQSKCNIKIKQADEKERIKNSVVYIAPPDYHLLIEKEFTFSLTIDPVVSYSRPSIDVLFESAAAVYRQTLIRILLTGSNKDGTDGLEAIKKYGGLTIAQLPSEAHFPYMPKHAIDSGCVMHVLELDDIQKMILNQIPKL